MIGLGNQAVPWQWRKPGGWTPASVSGLQVWYRADDPGCTFDTSPSPDLYESIPNRGSLNGALEASGAARPQLGSLNSRAAVDLDGANHYLVASVSKTALRPLHNGCGTIYCVVRPQSVTGFQHILDTLRADAPSRTGLLLRLTGSSVQAVIGNGGGAFPINAQTVSNVAIIGATHLIKVVFDYGGAGNEAEVFVDGISRKTASFASAPSLGDPTYDLHVGCRAADLLNKAQIDCGELIVYDSVVPGADDALVEGWLQERWGWQP